jgi:hypothetical protein
VTSSDVCLHLLLYGILLFSFFFFCFALLDPFYSLSVQPDIRRVADFHLRPRGQSPYDAQFGNGLRDYSPVVARTTVHARQLLTQRSSYLKAFVIHSRGAVNLTGCVNNCAGAVQGEKTFTAFLGCVSIPGEWGGACSNCVWTDAASRCRFDNSRTGPSVKRTNGAIGGSGGSGRSGGRAVAVLEEAEHLSDAE